MKRWLPIALLLLAAGALALQSSGETRAGAISGDSVACAALHTDVDGGALVSSDALLATKCYLVGFDVLRGGCGCSDLWILRYLCYSPANGWYYRNYWYCDAPDPNAGGELDPGGWTSMYSFKGSTCSSMNYVDPITVVFKGASSAQQVEQHAADHGYWTYHDGSSQLMFSYGYCYGMDGESNSEPGPPFQGEQYHMRLWEAKDFNGNPLCTDPYVLATPHHEDWGAPQIGCGDSGHSVYDNKTHPPGGFNGARDDIIKNWVGPHDLLEWQYWGNIQPFRQSKGYGVLNGCWWARADGWVAIIGIWH